MFVAFGDQSDLIIDAFLKLMKKDVHHTLKYFASPSENNEDREIPFFLYMDYQLGKLKPNLEGPVFQYMLKYIFQMVKETVIEILNDDVLKKSLFQKVLPARELVELLLEFNENLCAWFHADGNGLSKSHIDRTVHDLKVYLIFWCSPTPMIISTYENEGDTEEISKKQMKMVLKSRKDDKEATEFLKRLKQKKLEENQGPPAPTGHLDANSDIFEEPEESRPNGIFSFFHF